MTRNIKPLGVRMPEELKQWLKDQAEKNMRSLNSELVMRLQESRDNQEKTK